MAGSWADLSGRVNALLIARGEEWAGLPIPLPDLRLDIEPKNPWRARLLALGEDLRRPDDHVDEGSTCDLRAATPDSFLAPGVTVRNTWFSTRLRQQITLLEDVQGRVTFGMSRHDYVRRWTYAFKTMTAAAAWTVQTEVTALEKLAEILGTERQHLWEAYATTGAFLETSRRSGVTYFFRRCRPTIAVRNDHILCTLCLHPTGYYQETHAGSLCPTDDVIAHLLMMRGDEPLLWRRANQHHPMHPESGL